MKKLLLLLPLALLCGCAREPSPVSALALDRAGQTAPSGTAVFTEGKLSCFLDGGMIGGERFA